MSYNLVIATLDIYPREMKLLHSHKTVRTIICSSFMWNIVKLGTTKCPSPDEGLNQLLGIYTTEPYSGTHSFELLISTTIWVNLKGSMMSKKDNLKSTHIVGSHLYNILKMTNLWKWRAD